MLRNRKRRGNLLLLTYRKGLQADQLQIRVERALHRAEGTQVFDADALDEGLVAETTEETFPLAGTLVADDEFLSGQRREFAVVPVETAGVHDDAAERVAMPGDAFGGGMHHDVGTEFNWAE